MRRDGGVVPRSCTLSSAERIAGLLVRIEQGVTPDPRLSRA
jgi:hypothetical protein